MKISWRQTTPRPVGDVNIGDAFAYNGDIYMVIYDRFDKKTNTNDVKVLRLSDGSVEMFDGREVMVNEVDCELFVR